MSVQGALALCEFLLRITNCVFSKLCQSLAKKAILWAIFFCYCVHKRKIWLMRFLANANFFQVQKVALGKNPLYSYFITILQLNC